MKQKKNSKIILILIIIVLIILLIVGGVFVYLETDLLKSNKELFFKYVTQIADSENGFIDNNFKQYYEKQKNTPYTNEGTFSANITAENGQEQYNNVNKFNISFSGKNDTVNSKSMQDISLNYSDSVKFPISYKKIDNTIGLQTKYVGNKFIAVETDKLSNLSTDAEVSIEDTINSLEKIQEITKIELTDEEKNHIKNTYIGVLEQQLNEDSFSKVTESDSNGYRLTLTVKEIKNILVQLLEALKNDQTTLDKLNEYLEVQKSSAKITKSDIDEQIESINKDSDLDDENIEITVYSKMRKTNKLQITAQEGTLSIEKKEDDEQLKIELLYEEAGENTSKIALEVTFDGLQNMQTVKESYEIEVSNELMTYKYQYNNTINFTNSVDIEAFTDNNSMILTNYDSVQVANFLEAVVQRITEVNKQQMEELGLEGDENPIQYLIPSLEISSSPMETIDESSMSELEVNAFNSKFELYASTNQKGVTVKGLLSTISLNNESAKENMKITEINFCGQEYEATEQNITFIKEDVDLEKAYKVEFEKDQDTGMIYRAVINEK